MTKRPDESLGAALLTVGEMGEADRLTIEGGTPGIDLMEAAGLAVVRALQARFSPRPVKVLCGPGNNGGDGFVAARLLSEAGWEVTLGLLGDRGALKGDAALAAARWQGEVMALADLEFAPGDLVIDAIFGAGLARPVEGTPGEAIEKARAVGVPVVAVDVPSGVDGNTGEVLGTAPAAALTVTFFRKKAGHLLLPGRDRCGEVVVADIGIPPSVLETIRPYAFENSPLLWREVFPQPSAEAHKYTKGHAVVVSGPPHATGAARLAARGALRVGAGLVTVASPANAVLVNASHLTAIMLAAFRDAEGLAGLLADPRKNALALGPGLGLGEEAHALLDVAIGAGARLVLDADALTLTAAEPDAYLPRLKARASATVLTPHEGEFARLFGTPGGSKLERARAAAEASGSVVVLKGADTVIAAPDGRAAINGNAGPELGTAGSGDVLAGMIGGLLAQGMDGFEAAAAGVWLHGEAGRRLGRGLIAEDLPEALPAVLQALEARP